MIHIFLRIGPRLPSNHINIAHQNSDQHCPAIRSTLPSCRINIAQPLWFTTGPYTRLSIMKGTLRWKLLKWESSFEPCLLSRPNSVSLHQIGKRSLKPSHIVEGRSWLEYSNCFIDQSQTILLRFSVVGLTGRPSPHDIELYWHALVLTAPKPELEVRWWEHMHSSCIHLTGFSEICSIPPI